MLSLSDLRRQRYVVGSLFLKHTSNDVNEDKICQGNDATLMLRVGRKNRNSGVLNPIPLTSGDGSDLGHDGAKIVTLGFGMLSRGLPGCVPPIWREEARSKRFG